MSNTLSTAFGSEFSDLIFGEVESGHPLPETVSWSHSSSSRSPPKDTGVFQK